MCCCDESLGKKRNAFSKLAVISNFHCCHLWPVNSISMQIFPVSAGCLFSARLLLPSCPLSPSHPRLPPHTHSWPHSAPPPLCCTRAAPRIQPSQPPTRALGMNRSEKLSCIIKCAKVLLNTTVLDAKELYSFFSKRVQNAGQISWLHHIGVMCLTCAFKV